MTRATPVIAVDGTSGSGKSSVSRLVAAELGLAYLDTGAMYRAAAAAVLRAGCDPTDAVAVAPVVAAADIHPGTDPAHPTIELDGQDVAELIRGAAVTAAVSAVSAVPAVRAQLSTRQRDEVARSLAAGRGIVVEGRDIGTVVLPDADLKVFLVADAEVRAQRRATQDAERDATTVGADRALVQEQLERRDAADSGRAVSPLQAAADAVTVDATHLTLEQVVATVLALVDREATR